MSNENRWPNAGRLGNAQVRIAPAAAEEREQARVARPTTGDRQERTAPPLVIPQRGEYVPWAGGRTQRKSSGGSGRARGGGESGAGRAREREAPQSQTQRETGQAGRQSPPFWAREAADLASGRAQTHVRGLWEGNEGWFKERPGRTQTQVRGL